MSPKVNIQYLFTVSREIKVICKDVLTKNRQRISNRLRDVSGAVRATGGQTMGQQTLADQHRTHRVRSNDPRAHIRHHVLQRRRQHTRSGAPAHPVHHLALALLVGLLAGRARSVGRRGVDRLHGRLLAQRLLRHQDRANANGRPLHHRALFHWLHDRL